MKILLDCDPGHDDAIALLLALASPELELLGVTTVAGNQTLDKQRRPSRSIGTQLTSSPTRSARTTEV